MSVHAKIYTHAPDRTLRLYTHTPEPGVPELTAMDGWIYTDGSPPGAGRAMAKWWVNES